LQVQNETKAAAGEPVPKTSQDEAVQPEGNNDEVALKAFFSIAEKWRLTTEEQMKLLGSPPRSTFFKWKKEGGQISPDTLERISHILNIYKCLRIVLTDEAASDEWVRKANQAPFLKGVSALEFMTRDGYLSDVYQVRRYLDGQRGG
jgi:SOS-response transcriptional repressor LexA